MNLPTPKTNTTAHFFYDEDIHTDGSGASLRSETKAGKRRAAAEVPADEGTLDEVLVEGSWFKREELPTILGNFMRALDESQRREKELIVTLTELRPVRDADTEALFAAELQKARAEGERAGRDAQWAHRPLGNRMPLPGDAS